MGIGIVSKLAHSYRHSYRHSILKLKEKDEGHSSVTDTIMVRKINKKFLVSLG